MSVFILLTPGFPENEEDSTCLPAFQKFALSVKKNYPLLPFMIISLQYPFIRQNYEWHGIPVIAIGGNNKPGIQRVFTWAKAFLYLRKINKEQGVGGILSLWLSECSLLGNYFSRFSGCKQYMWLIGQDAKKSNQYIQRIKPPANKIIAMSDFLQEEYLKNHNTKPFLVVENGIDKNAFPDLNIGKREIDVLGVGSLIPLKNYSLFIEIIYELKKTYPSINVVIAGEGIEEQALKDKVKNLGLEHTITFKGSIPHTQIFELMNHSKIFLHTSNYEGNSTVLMEALYSGCFTISTQALSNKELRNFQIAARKDEFVQFVHSKLQNYGLPHERICFNTMDQSVKKIMDLFLPE